MREREREEVRGRLGKERERGWREREVRRESVRE